MKTKRTEDRKRTEHQLRKAEFEALRRVIELDLITRLTSICRRPTLAEAERLSLEAPLQETAVYAAVELWKLAKHYQDKEGHRFSYRNFLVTAAGIGIVRNGSRKCKWAVRTATNTKWIAGRYPKHCAEMRVMKALKARSAILLNMTVHGLPQPHEDTATLHPCEVCRLLMRERYRLLFQPFTRIICVHPTDPRREGYSLEELLKRHHEHA